MSRSEPLRIIQVIPSLQKGGAERLCLDIVRWLRKLPGMEVLLVTLDPINSYRKEYPDIEPTVIDACVVPSVLGKWKVNIASWEQVLDDFRPQVVHSHLFQAEVLTRYRLRPGVRYFTHCHDNMPQLKRLEWKELTSKHRLTEAFERSYMLDRYRKCDNRFIAISPDTEAYFRENLPDSLARNITLLPNAIDCSRFSARTASPPSPGGVVRLINIGSFVPKKNQAFLLGVLQKLRSDGMDAHLTLVGDGPLRHVVMDKAKEMNLEPFVHFPGNVDRVEELLWESHVYVHSATYEPFGLVLLEAMAAGLPVVALDGRGNRELIVDGQNGYLLNQGDEENFMKRISDIIHSSQIWNHVHDSAIRLSQKHDMRDYIHTLVRTYALGHLS
jgi:glycosyltransferase involved in cell wall biosynthesis